jgi:ATP-binding cassette, sub-family E, member 1
MQTCKKFLKSLKESYMFDEPSSYLDIRQRLRAGEVIRSVVQSDKYVVVVEHDLSLLDYLSDKVCVLYGVPGAYGVISLPFSVREGINVFLSGFLPTENLRFREFSLTFKVSESTEEVSEEESRSRSRYKFPDMSLSYESLKFLNSKFRFQIECQRRCLHRL